MLKESAIGDHGKGIPAKLIVNHEVKNLGVPPKEPYAK
jgi:hypothetical protein